MMVGRRSRAGTQGRRRTEDKKKETTNCHKVQEYLLHHESWDSLSEIWEVSSDNAEPGHLASHDSVSAWFTHLTYILDSKMSALEYSLQTIMSRVSVCRCLSPTKLRDDSSSERDSCLSSHMSFIEEMEQRVADSTSEILNEYDDMVSSASKLLDMAESLHKSQTKTRQGWST
eukprot:764568-Hanusia_phi.AAC.1